MQVNVIVVKDMVQLDITGPFEVQSLAPGCTVDLVAARRERGHAPTAKIEPRRLQFGHTNAAEMD